MDSIVVRNAKHDSLNYGFNANGDLVKGQVVKLEAAGTVAKVSAGTQMPFGIIEVPGLSGKRVTVRSFLAAEVYGKAKVQLAPGDEVVATGVIDSEGRQEFTKAAAGDFVNAVVLKGGNADAEVLVGIIDGVYQKNPAGA